MFDPRNIAHGYEIPSLGYCDQPYVVKTPDGAWLCTMTTGAGPEGAGGQHIVATRSLDRGRTWSPLVAIEPPDGPEASWVMPLIVPSGRVYAFYTYNAQNLREVLADDNAVLRRVDTLGEYAFKWSDDGGLTWSSERLYIPVREGAIDRANPYGGAVRFFWGVGKPIVDRGVMYLGFSKVGRFGTGFLAQSEGWFLRSDNILTEPDPTRIRWETLPDGDVGLRAPEGPIAEEANLTALSDGSLFCTCRTVTGHPCQAYSRDGGHTWTPPAYMEYGPGGPLVNNPRAANFCRRLSDGRYLYWFHNNCATTYSSLPEGRGSRNPAWLLGGVERDGPDGKVLHWGRPEVVLYADHPHVGISYPDFVEDDGHLYITATQKTVARVHEVPAWLLARLWEGLE